MSNPGGEVLLAKWGDGAAYTYAEVAAIPTRPGSLTIARGGSAELSASVERANALKLFAANLHKAFFGFEPDFFQHNLLRLVDEAAHVIKGSIELWPTLIEICYFQKGRKGLPQLRVKNRRLTTQPSGAETVRSQPSSIGRIDFHSVG
jgi:hypothetical protein